MNFNLPDLSKLSDAAKSFEQLKKASDLDFNDPDIVNNYEEKKDNRQGYSDREERDRLRSHQHRHHKYGGGVANNITSESITDFYQDLTGNGNKSNTIQLSGNHDIAQDFDQKIASFDSFFEQNINQTQDALEAERKSLIEKMSQRKLIISILTAIYIGVCVFIGKLGLLFFPGPLLLALFYLWQKMPENTYQKSFKEKPFSQVFNFFNINYSHQGSQNIQRYEKFDILPKYESFTSSTEDLIATNYKDTGIVIEELYLGKIKRTKVHNSSNDAINIASDLAKSVLKKNNKKKKDASFQGLVANLEFNKTFQGQTIVKQDKGGKLRNMFGNKFGNKNIKHLERVELEDVEFEDKFEIYSDNQIEARFLLTPSFMVRVLNLSKFLQSDSFEFGFKENSLFLAFNGSQNLFEAGPINQSVNLKGECQKIIEEIKLITSIVDELKLDQRTGL